MAFWFQNISKKEQQIRGFSFFVFRWSLSAFKTPDSVGRPSSGMPGRLLSSVGSLEDAKRGEAGGVFGAPGPSQPAALGTEMGHSGIAPYGPMMCMVIFMGIYAKLVIWENFKVGV